MIPALIAGAAAGLGSSIFGDIKNSQARKKQEDLLKQQSVDNELWFKRNYYGNYMDMPDVQSALTTLQERLKDNSRKTEGRAAMTGASDEAKLAARSSAEKTYADAVRSIAGDATTYKRGVESEYLRRKDALGNSWMNMYNNQAQQGSNLANNGINAVLGLIGSNMG